MCAKDASVQTWKERALKDAENDELMRDALPLINSIIDVYAEAQGTEASDAKTLSKLAQKIIKTEQAVYAFFADKKSDSLTDKVRRSLQINRDAFGRWVTLYGYLSDRVTKEITEYQERVKDYCVVPAASVREEKRQYLDFRSEFADLKIKADVVKDLYEMMYWEKPKNLNYLGDILRVDDGHMVDYHHSEAPMNALQRAREPLSELQEDLFRHSDYEHEAKSIRILWVTALISLLAFGVSALNFYVDASRSQEINIIAPELAE